MNLEREMCMTGVAILALSLAAYSETVEVRILKGTDAATARVGETRSVELTPQADGALRFVLAKADIPADAFSIEVVPPFMTAQKGDDGWWMQGRGTYGRFDKDDGEYSAWRQLMPVFAVKRGATLWYGEVKGWRFDYDFVARARGGRYEVFPRFRCGGEFTRPGESDKYYGVCRFFPAYYQDIVVDFRRLEGAAADYNGVARAYREARLGRGEIRPIKERVKEHPELDYLCDAIVVRIQTHAAKPIPETADGIAQKFFRRGEELPVVVHMPFGVCEEYLQAFKDAGIDKLSVCSAGWQDGGYDGRSPGHFPVCAEAGGEEAYRRLIAKAKALGYQFAVHQVSTDGYMCSRWWDEDWVCKFADGGLYTGGVWSGGQCHWVCQRCAWERWMPEEMRKIAALGIRGPHYIDVYSATYPIPCGDRRHPCTPEQTAEFQNRILAFARDLMGGAASESGYDHVAGNIDYINYVERDLKLLHEGRHHPLVAGVFPFWELVYHGIILYTPDRLCQNHTRGKCLYKLEKSGDPRWMEGDGVEDPYAALKIVEFGGRPIFYTYKFADVPRIRKAWDEFVPFRHLQREAMTGHLEIAPNVFETVYENGERTVCDYNDFTARLVDGSGRETRRVSFK